MSENQPQDQEKKEEPKEENTENKSDSQEAKAESNSTQENPIKNYSGYYQDPNKSMERNSCSGEMPVRQTGSAIAFMGLITGVLALVGLIYFAPSLKIQVDTLSSEVNGVAKSVQSVERRIKEVDGTVKSLDGRVGNFEKTITVMELKRILDTLENISQNLPQTTLQKTQLLRENIRSILADLGGESPVTQQGAGKTDIKEPAKFLLLEEIPQETTEVTDQEPSPEPSEGASPEAKPEAALETTEPLPAEPTVAPGNKPAQELAAPVEEKTGLYQGWMTPEVKTETETNAPQAEPETGQEKANPATE